MYWVNRSVHGYKGHEYVYIIECVSVSVSVCLSRDMKSQSCINQKGKYVKGCLQAKNNNAVCVCSNIISLVKSETLEQSSMALRTHLLLFYPFFFQFKYNTYNSLSDEIYMNFTSWSKLPLICYLKQVSLTKSKL